MTTYNNRARPIPMKPLRMWGVFNYGLLVAVHFTRKAAFEFVDGMNPNDTGWVEWRRHYTVEPLRVAKEAIPTRKKKGTP